MAGAEILPSSVFGLTFEVVWVCFCPVNIEWMTRTVTKRGNQHRAIRKSDINPPQQVHRKLQPKSMPEDMTIRRYVAKLIAGVVLNVQTDVILSPLGKTRNEERTFAKIRQNGRCSTIIT